MDSKRYPRGSRGGFALFAGVSAAVLIGLLALAADVGLAFLSGHREQLASEAAALASVRQLDGTPIGLIRARATAASMIRSQERAGALRAESEAEVVFGVWDGERFTTSGELTAINAVRIEAGARRSNPLLPVFSSLFSMLGGQKTVAGGARGAIAYRQVPESSPRIVASR
jgi:hypothetical protein